MKLQEILSEIFEKMDLKSVQIFVEIFGKKLEELKNEQTNLQKNTGASR